MPKQYVLHVSQVDVKRMGPKTRRDLVETALGADDNEQFLKRVRERMDK